MGEGGHDRSWWGGRGVPCASEVMRTRRQPHLAGVGGGGILSSRSAQGGSPAFASAKGTHPWGRCVLTQALLLGDRCVPWGCRKQVLGYKSDCTCLQPRQGKCFEPGYYIIPQETLTVNIEKVFQYAIQMIPLHCLPPQATHSWSDTGIRVSRWGPARLSLRTPSFSAQTRAISLVGFSRHSCLSRVHSGQKQPV